MRFSPLTSAPTLETERLLLREFRGADLDHHAAILADPVVMQHFHGVTVGREDAFRRLVGSVGLWLIEGIGILAAERKSDRKLVGHVGLFDYRREMVPSIEGKPELGYMFAAEVHGQGIAREATEALLDWSDANVDAGEVVALISSENRPSITLAKRLGFERLPDGTYRDEPTMIWGRRRRA